MNNKQFKSLLESIHSTVNEFRINEPTLSHGGAGGERQHPYISDPVVDSLKQAKGITKTASALFPAKHHNTLSEEEINNTVDMWHSLLGREGNHEMSGHILGRAAVAHGPGSIHHAIATTVLLQPVPKGEGARQIIENKAGVMDGLMTVKDHPIGDDHHGWHLPEHVHNDISEIGQHIQEHGDPEHAHDLRAVTHTLRTMIEDRKKETD